MTKKEEAAYEQVRRGMATRILEEAARELGYRDPIASAAGLIAQRERLIAALRGVCKDHGDNDWSDDLDPADIIEKHLVRHLGSSK